MPFSGQFCDNVGDKYVDKDGYRDLMKQKRSVLGLDGISMNPKSSLIKSMVKKSV